MDIYVQHLNMLLISFNKSSCRTSIMIWHGNAMYQFLVSVKHKRTLHLLYHVLLYYYCIIKVSLCIIGLDKDYCA